MCCLVLVAINRLDNEARIAANAITHHGSVGARIRPIRKPDTIAALGMKSFLYLSHVRLKSKIVIVTIAKMEYVTIFTNSGLARKFQIASNQTRKRVRPTRALLSFQRFFQFTIYFSKYYLRQVQGKSKQPKLAPPVCLSKTSKPNFPI